MELLKLIQQLWLGSSKYNPNTNQATYSWDDVFYGRIAIVFIDHHHQHQTSSDRSIVFNGKTTSTFEFKIKDLRTKCIYFAPPEAERPS